MFFDKTLESKETNSYAPSWIQTHNLSKHADADPLVRQRGRCERLF